MGDVMKRYRNEWKYICDDRKLQRLESKISPILAKDIHSNSDGIYVVHNLYLDDYYDTCARKTEAGDYKRFKWRIRYYDSDITTIRLELKEKLYSSSIDEFIKSLEDNGIKEFNSKTPIYVKNKK